MADQLPGLGKRELICLISFTCNYVVCVRRGFLFVKIILNLKKSTPSYMIYGELGIYPLEVDIKTRIISFWSKLLDFDSNKLSSMVYQVNKCLFDNKKCKPPWLEQVKNLIEKNGFGNIWTAPQQVHKKWFCLAFKQKLKDTFLQNWESLLSKSSSGTNYRIFKTEFGISNFFNTLSNRQCK